MSYKSKEFNNWTTKMYRNKAEWKSVAWRYQLKWFWAFVTANSDNWMMRTKSIDKILHNTDHQKHTKGFNIIHLPCHWPMLIHQVGLWHSNNTWLIEDYAHHGWIKLGQESCLTPSPKTVNVRKILHNSIIHICEQSTHMSLY